jgi:hypothetical protein
MNEILNKLSTDELAKMAASLGISTSGDSRSVIIMKILAHHGANDPIEIRVNLLEDTVLRLRDHILILGRMVADIVHIISITNNNIVSDFLSKNSEYYRRIGKMESDRLYFATPESLDDDLRHRYRPGKKRNKRE